ncbi:murein DD-endopeptidase MepM/ murein hydrolase activator NlpD [Paraburkholderia sp. GAS333]|uniref:M23 family metallopeptidase n=1 Tax=Paraburkholderia sp. GAS333 TaxID=3156279 RepID=UPI003D25A0C7
MASVFRAGSQLASGSIDFVTRRTAVALAVGVACGAAALALAAGVAIGMLWSAHHLDDPRDAAGNRLANSVERDYAIDQIGKLSASVAQIEPRIARLTKQVDTLRDFEARLHTPRPAPRAPAAVDLPSDTSATDSIGEGAGGPALPPRRCSELAAQSRGRANAARTGEQLDCLSSTLSALEHEIADHTLAYAAFPGRMPADGARFGSPFGNRSDPFTHRLNFHSGIDLVAKTGTPILAAAGGRVVFAGEEAGYGNAVEIDHGNGLMTRYGHASKLVVHVGDLVLPRQYIADVGSTGRSTGPHLHFEVLVNGMPVDPSAYLALFAPTAHG